MQPRDLGLEAAKIRDFVPEFQGYNRETLPTTFSIEATESPQFTP